jgi:putative ABC transport system permease protein
VAGYNIYATIMLVVPNEQQLSSIESFEKEIYAGNASTVHNFFAFDLVNCSDDKSEQLYDKISNQIDDVYVVVENASVNRQAFYSLYGGLFFLGILLSIVFACAGVLIMYYKQVTEGYEDAHSFDILQKVGMTDKEIRKSISSQILTVFFAPLAMAGLHTGFAFPIVLRLLNLFGLSNTPLLIGVTLGAFVAFAIIYAVIYKITSKSYYKIVSK